jgi:hypothetical protein
MALAFTPNLVNAQFLGNKDYFPQQFGPRDAAGNDIFEQAVKAQFKDAAQFVDDWFYHINRGEIHCATLVKRAVLDFDWWTKIPGP